MTSKQVMLIVAALLLGGCGLFPRPPADELAGPYPSRHVWAIVPLGNESGTQQADGAVLADHLHRQLENASNLDVLPVNRTIAAMNALQMSRVSDPAQAMHLMRTLGVDGLVVGTVTAYDPYDPPKLGLTLELYVDQRVDSVDAASIRRLRTSATDPAPAVQTPASRRQPVTVASAVLDAGDPRVRELLEYYASQRGPVLEKDAWRRYRISMDLYSEFAAYVMSRRLLEAERQRVAPPTSAANEKPPTP
ncbi:MAG: hypothetical protein WD042_16180 [Phycisphaeraceae bacterium]